MASSLPALSNLDTTQIIVASGSTFSVESLKAGLNKISQMQEEGTAVDSYTDIICLMDNPYTACTWDIVVTAGSTFSTGTVTLATAVADDTVTINGLVYTAVTGTKSDNTEFSIDGTDTVDAADLVESINADARTGTVGDVTAENAAAIVTLTSTLEGTAGDVVTLVSSNGTTLAVSGAVFSGGVDSADFQLTFNSETITNETSIGRPALSSRRVLDIEIEISGFAFTVRSALAALNLVEKFEDAVAVSGTSTTGDGTFTDQIARGPTPYQEFIWDVIKAADVYTLTPTENS